MATSNAQANNLATLQAALASANDGDVIELTAAITLPANANETISFSGGNVTLVVAGAHRHFDMRQVNSTLTIGAGIILEGHRTGDIAGWSVSDPTWPEGGGVEVFGAGGTFNLDGGTIRGINNNTGVVLVSGGHFNMISGAVSHNRAGNSGVIDIRSVNAAFTMIGGTISHNIAVNGGGLSLINNATGTMSGGTIERNLANRGGGVRIASNATFYMSGTAHIYSNQAIRGGGVSVVGDYPATPTNRPVFTMLGGSIDNNHAIGNASFPWIAASARGFGGGVEVMRGAIFNMSGGAVERNHVEDRRTGGTDGHDTGSAGVGSFGGTFNFTGGAIRYNEGFTNVALRFDNGVFNMSQPDDSNPPRIYNNFAHGWNGAAVGLHGNSLIVNISGGIIENNHSETASERDSNYDFVIAATPNGSITGGSIESLRHYNGGDNGNLTVGEDVIINHYHATTTGDQPVEVRIPGYGTVTVSGGTRVETPGADGAGTVDITMPGETDPITVPPGSIVLPNPDPDTDGAIVVLPDGTTTVEVPPGHSVDTNGVVTSPPDSDGNVTTTLPGGGGSVTAPDGSTVTGNPDGSVNVELPGGGNINVPDGSTVTENPDGSANVELPGGGNINVPDGSTVGNPDSDGNIPVTPPGGDEPILVPPGGSINEDGEVEDADGNPWTPEEPEELGVPTPPATEAPELEITLQPQATGTNLINGVATVTQGQISGNLTIAATATAGATLTYQWYRNGVAIPDAITASIAIPTDLTVGMHNFHVVATATINPSTTVTSHIIAVNVVASQAGSPGTGSDTGAGTGTGSESEDSNSGDSTSNQPSTNQPDNNQPSGNQPGSQSGNNQGDQTDNNQDNEEISNDTANQGAANDITNAWSGINDTITPDGNISTAIPNPTIAGNQLVQYGDMWIELDDAGVPLGAWTWDEAQEIWIYDENVPLAAFDAVSAVAAVAGVSVATSQVADAVALMPQTDVESNVMQFMLLFALAMIIAVASFVVIKHETKKRTK